MQNLGSIEHYLVNASTLVAYQVKTLSLPPARIPQGTAFDNVLTVYKIKQDNENRLKPQAGNVLLQNNDEFLNVTNINKNYICSHHLIRIKVKVNV